MPPVLPRSENGKRLVAEDLHAEWNKNLSCPNCGYQNCLRGTFNKDSAGKADSSGSLYCRFLCLSGGPCLRSIGVTEFINLCESQSKMESDKAISVREPQTEILPLALKRTLSQVSLKSQNDNRKSIKHSRDYHTGDVSEESDHEVISLSDVGEIFTTSPLSGIPVKRDIAKTIEQLSQSLTREIKFREDLQSQVKHLGERLAKMESKAKHAQKTVVSDSETQAARSASASHVRQSNNKLDLSYNTYHTLNVLLNSYFTFSIMQPEHSGLTDGQSPTPMQLLSDTRIAYSSILQNLPTQTRIPTSDNREQAQNVAMRPDIDGDKETKKMNPSFLRSQQVLATAAIYLAEVPHTPIREVKKLLAQTPTSIHLRHIRNLSWIEDQILEILVDSNHLQKFKNRIIYHSNFRICSKFNPLDPASFDQENNIPPESKHQVLRSNLINRLASSISSTSQMLTRKNILSWAENRSIGVRLRTQLQRDGIRVEPHGSIRQD
ncbi:hypothetical protein HOY82DRAFT_542461 [Tuber indicum]|nr:hypothetical protein HOY82DRAFT_542461 [Tuber indicum]